MAIEAKNYNLIVLVIILGVAAGVLLCWAVYHFFYNNKYRETNPYTMSGDQAVYMREVRLRNLENIAAVMGRSDVLRELKGGYRDSQRL